MSYTFILSSCNLTVIGSSSTITSFTVPDICSRTRNRFSCTTLSYSRSALSIDCSSTCRIVYTTGLSSPSIRSITVPRSLCPTCCRIICPGKRSFQTTSSCSSTLTINLWDFWRICRSRFCLSESHFMIGNCFC